VSRYICFTNLKHLIFWNRGSTIYIQSRFSTLVCYLQFLWPFLLSFSLPECHVFMVLTGLDGSLFFSPTTMLHPVAPHSIWLLPHSSVSCLLFMSGGSSLLLTGSFFYLTCDPHPLPVGCFRLALGLRTAFTSVLPQFLSLGTGEKGEAKLSLLLPRKNNKSPYQVSKKK
jgi:hypothetical protein